MKKTSEHWDFYSRNQCPNLDTVRGCITTWWLVRDGYWTTTQQKIPSSLARQESKWYGDIHE